VARNDDDQGELIAGQDGASVRVAFAGERVALVLLGADPAVATSRIELTPESAARLAVEVELAAESLVHERKRRFSRPDGHPGCQEPDIPAG
jgi:hypothetical protein